MAGTRRVIRKVEHSTIADFDDQLWPINCALLVLAGFVSGIIIATSDFHEGPFWQNGWFRLGILAVTLVALFAGTWWLHRRKHVRRMQLAVFLSLLLNMGIEMWLFRSYMHLNVVARESDAHSEWIDQREEVFTMPDYGREPVEQVTTEELERPLETVTPETRPQETTRQETSQPPTPRPTPTEPVETTAQPVPATIQRAQTAVSAPRRTEQAGGMQVSRTEMRAPAAPSAAMPTPEVATVSPSQQSNLNANVTPLARSATSEPELARRPTNQQAAQAAVSAPQVARSTPTAEAPSPTAAASVARQSPQLPQQQPTQAETIAPAEATAANTPSQVAPSAAQVARQQAATPATRQTTESPASATSASVSAPQVARSSTAADAPSASGAAAASVARQTPAAATANPTSAEQSQPTSVAAAGSPSLQPAQSAVNRQQAAGTTGAANTAAASSAASASATAQVSSAAPSRAISSTAQSTPAAASANPGSIVRAATAAAGGQSTAQPIATPAAQAAGGASGALEASTGASVARAAAVAPAARGEASDATAAGAAAQQAGQARVSRATQAAESGQTAAAQPAPLGRTAASRTASTAASAAAEVPSTQVAESGGTPTPSANAQATTVARSSGAVPLPQGTGPARAQPGEALNTARGLAQAAPRRAETSSDSRLSSNTPGTGQVARSQGVASGASPSTAVPIEAPTSASGSLSQQPSTAPQQALTGVARASGQAPIAVSSAPTSAEPGTGTTPEAPATGISRAATAEAASGPQVGQGAASLARSNVSSAAAGAGTATAVEAAPAAVTGAGSPGSLEAATSQVARLATSAGTGGGPTSGTGVTGSQASPATMAGSGPTRAQGSTQPASGTTGQPGPIGRASSSTAMATGLATAEAPGGADTTASSGPSGVAANTSATSVSRQAATAVGAGGGQTSAGSGSAQASVSGPQITAAQRGEAGGPTGAMAGPNAVARSSSGGGTIDSRAEPAAAPTAVAATGNSPGTTGEANVGQVRQSAGLPGTSLTPSEATSVGGAGAVATGTTAARRAEGGAETGLQVSAAAGITQRQNLAGALPSGLSTADEPGPLAGAATGDVASTVGEGPATQLARQASGALPVQIAALEGPGSLTNSASPTPGLPSRLARPDAETIHQAAQRFLLSRTSASPAPAFTQRAPEARSQTAPSRGASSGSEKAVEMGLAYLAGQQLADGRWSLQNVAAGGTAQDAAAGAGQMQADTAATGMALLCFLGAGYTHADGKYQDNVAAGIANLVHHQKDNGDLFAGGSKYVWFYSHGIAAIALCEAYGMTGDPDLREPAQKALDFVIASQHPTFGGWRYSPQSSTDTSVSGWQMMALKSGELAGLKVPSDAYEKVTRWLDGAQAVGGSQYSYRPEAQIAHQRNPSLAMSAEGLLMRLYTGWPRSHPQMIAGVEHLRQNLPSIGTRAQPLRDSYYWYYATQVMFQAQGDAWNHWNERLRTLLINSQTTSGPLAGSWDPRGAVPDRWGLEGGRLYVTAMHLLMLEVYYRHLPLYKIE